MRKQNDNRHDDIVKEEILKTILENNHEILFTLDDRGRVVDMWRKNGIKCFQVEPCFESIKSVKRVRKPTLHIMVGGSGAGKSTFIKNNMMVPQGSIISSDNLREQFTGDFKDQTHNDLVFEAMHEIARTRLTYGLDVVLDATHIKAKDRKKSAMLGVELDANIVYVVIDRPLKSKMGDAGWKSSVMIGDKTLVEKHHETFNMNKKNILNGDGIPGVTVLNMIEER